MFAVAGGDGTVNARARRALATDVVVAPLPLGTLATSPGPASPTISTRRRGSSASKRRVSTWRGQRRAVHQQLGLGVLSVAVRTGCKPARVGKGARGAGGRRRCAQALAGASSRPGWPGRPGATPWRGAGCERRWCSSAMAAMSASRRVGHARRSTARCCGGDRRHGGDPAWSAARGRHGAVAGAETAGDVEQLEFTECTIPPGRPPRCP